MKSAWPVLARLLAGCSLAVATATPQAFTISAKPGAVSFVEGEVTLDGQPLSVDSLRNVFMNANGILATESGKAEVLLTPGVFLRVAEFSQIRMVAPSLINTQIAIERGEVMLEVDEYIKENQISILDQGAVITVEKNGLYRFTAGNPPKASTLDGKLTVSFNERQKDLKKGKEVVLTPELRLVDFDTKAPDELYAWSNIRSQYNASMTYRAATDLASSSALNNGFYGPGWYWNSGFSSYLWMPGAAGFFSPFGYGFYGPGYVGNVTLVGIPSRGLAGFRGGSGAIIAVPVNGRRPPAFGGKFSSPAEFQAARQAWKASHPGFTPGGNGWHPGNPNPGGANPSSGTAGAASNGGRHWGGGSGSTPSSGHATGGGGGSRPAGGGGYHPSGGGGGGGFHPSASPGGAGHASGGGGGNRGK